MDSLPLTGFSGFDFRYWQKVYACTLVESIPNGAGIPMA
jgi:hypothetical protein